MKVFIDANILIDLLLERRPFYQTATGLLSYCLEHDIEIVTNSLCIANAHYLSQQIIRNTTVTRNKIEGLNKICKVVKMDQNQLDNALNSGFVDFEDALHNSCAINNDCTHIVTRDKKGFKKSKLIVLTPVIFLKFNES